MKNAHDWWLEQWTCPVCFTTITKHHKSRHFASRGHQQRALQASLETDSDYTLARFLAHVDPRNFHGAEKRIYDKMRAANDD